MYVFTKIQAIDALLAGEPECTNNHGNTMRECFRDDLERCFFDARLDGGQWVQLDTDMDAAYFGCWLCQADRRILIFAEGDLSAIQCVGAESFDHQLTELCESFDEAPSMVALGEGQIMICYQDRAGLFIDPERGKRFRLQTTELVKA